MFKGRASQGTSLTTSPRQYQLRPVQLKRMLKWAFFAASVFALGTWLFIIISGKFQERKFFAEVQRRQSMGDKVLVDDFRTVPPPDDENAATYLQKASDQLRLNPHEQWLIDGVGDYRPSEEAKSFVAQYSSAHPQIRGLIHQAESCPQVDWHVKWRSPALEVLMPYLDPQRELVHFLYAVGICEHEAGDDAAALQTARDIFFLARAVDIRSPMVGHLVAIGLEQMGADLCLRLADPVAPPSAQDKSDLSAVAQLMIAGLCEDAVFRSQFDAAVRADRMVQVDSVIHLPATKFEVFSAGNALLEDDDQAILAVAQPSWPVAHTMLPSAQRKSEPYFAQLMAFPWWRAFESEFRTEAERHAAAIAIACRLYTDDHGGKWPPHLSALVPDYLPAIPSDPFDAQLRPMKYLPGNPPAIYSISIDGIDNKGDRTGAISYHNGFSYNPWLSPDAVLPIGGVVEPAEKRPPEEP